MSLITKRFTNILEHPFVLFICMGVGIIIGQYIHPLHESMDFIAKIFMRLLEICIIPIVISVITVNVGKATRIGNSLLVRWLVVSSICVIFVGVVTIAVNFYFSNYIISDAKTLNEIHSIATGKKYDIENIEYKDSQLSAVKTIDNEPFVYNLVPENIFKALLENDTLCIIFFFIIVGVMVAHLPKDKSRTVFSFFNRLNDVFSRLLSAILVFLPLGVISIFSKQFSNPDAFALVAHLFPLLMLQLALAALVYCFAALMIKHSTGVGFYAQMIAMRRTFFIALGTMDTLACIPMALRDSRNRLKIRHNIVNTLLPISIILAKPDTMFFEGSLAVYGTILYDIDVTFSSLVTVIVSILFYSVVVTGVPDVFSTNFLYIILEPLLLPADLLSTIYSMIIPVMDPLFTFLCVYFNIAIVSVLSKKKS